MTGEFLVPLSKEEFDKLPDPNKLGVIFDCLTFNTKLIQDLQKRKRIDTSITGLGGVIGGFVAVVLAKIFKLD